MVRFTWIYKPSLFRTFFNILNGKSKMQKIKDLDVVKLTKDIPEKNLKKGTFGTVIFLFEIPCLAYEIEILDGKNKTTIITTLTPDQIELDNSRN